MLDPSRHTSVFGPDGTLAIRADCNTVSGAYTRSGGQLRLQLGCPPDSQADQFTADLSQVRQYTLVSGDPVATPGKMMVMGPGGYHSGDDARLGLPLLAWFAIVSVGLVPLICHFQGASRHANCARR